MNGISWWEKIQGKSRARIKTGSGGQNWCTFCVAGLGPTLLDILIANFCP